MDAGSNPYEAPRYGGEVDGHDFHDEVSATQATGVVKAAGGLQAAAGVLLASAGVQLKLVGIIGRPWVMRVPWLMILGGVVAVFFAVKIFKTRGWAALGGTVVNGLVLVGMGLWVLLTLASGFVSLIATLVPMVALAGTVLGALAIGPCLRADAARRKLQEAGIDLSF
jgi:hypothetical protein